MLSLLLLLGIAVPVGGVWPPPAETVATEFVRVLRSGDMEQLATIATGAAVASEDWRELRHAVEKFDCISIRAHSVEVTNITETEAALVVTTDATAFARGNKSPLRLPRRWHVVAVPADGGWKLQSILNEEKVIARRLMAVPELTEQTFLDAVGNGDLERILLEFISHPGLYANEGTAKADLARGIARKRGLVMPELVSLLEESLLLLEHRNNPAGAQEVGERMIAFAELHALPDGLATARLTAGVLAWRNGRFDDALEHFAVASSLMNDVEDPRGPMKALYMRALLLMNRGRYREALASAAILGDAAERFSWLEGVFLTSVLRGSTFTLLQDKSTAAHFDRHALRLAERMRREEFITISLSNLAEAEEALENGAEAARLRQRIVARARSAKADQAALATMHLSLATALAKDNRRAQADAELQTALRIARSSPEKLLEAEIVQALAQLRLAESRPEEALRFAEEADALARQFGATIGLHRGTRLWAIRSTLGSALRATGKEREAAEALRSSIDLIEAARSSVGADEVALSSFLRDKAHPYLELMSLHIDQGRSLDALVVSERFRARALATAAAQGNVDPFASMTEADRKRHDSLQDAISDLNRKLLADRDAPANAAIDEQLGQVRAELRAFLSQIYAARADIRHRSLEDPAIVLADGARVLPDANEIALSFSVHDDRTYVFCIERAADRLELSVRRIPVGKAELEERIRRFVARIERRDLDYRRDARSLHDLLLQPFASQVAGKRLLYLIPDGMLWRLPFQALQRPDGKYVAETVAVAYTPSLLLLRNKRRRDQAEPARPALLAIADPTLPQYTATTARATHRDVDLGPLPDTRSEVEAIRDLYDEKSRVLLGPAATESAAKSLAPRFGVLHFATHGILVDGAPMYSALVLAGSGTDDGLLEAREMMELPLGADLAILSACESAGGDVTPGEGIIGMSWALMVAGCRNTVVSQWKVESRSTAALMIAFHRHAARGGDYAYALQRAQRELMKQDEFSHPYYWSAFVLVATSQ